MESAATWDDQSIRDNAHQFLYSAYIYRWLILPVIIKFMRIAKFTSFQGLYPNPQQIEQFC
jgi:hypothetical protein